MPSVGHARLKSSELLSCRRNVHREVSERSLRQVVERRLDQVEVRTDELRRCVESERTAPST